MTALNQAAGRLIPQDAQWSRDSPANSEAANASSAEPRVAGSQAADEDKQGEEEQTESGDETKSQELTPDEEVVVSGLRQRDMEVRAHEQAHAAAGGSYVTKAPSYDYQTGPDGNRYAVGGEVSIDTSPVPNDPAATMEKARVILRAALAPAEPSSQDYRVAAQARSMEAQAHGEMLEENLREMSGSLEQSEEKEDEEPALGDTADASARLRQRFAGFFAAPASHGLSQFA
ncbi:putative metalloprotease CJM1_0395 family protein [Thiorhodovibrio winogradskyi]|nr:putative metalloprotease CJM1_0395 family protein [Thiorhodovibrio winogradskyi]